MIKCEEKFLLVTQELDERIQTLFSKLPHKFSRVLNRGALAVFSQ